MEQRIFHGNIQPDTVSQAIIANFDRGNYKVQQIGSGDEIAVQIATPNYAQSGGQTALSVAIRKVADGISVTLGQQAWFGVAASIGVTALAALRNPFSLLSRLDDLAQDVESLKLRDDVWQLIDTTCRSIGSGFELSNRLKRYICDYCNTANPPGEPRCIACGAPLGDIQPNTCKNCGYIITNSETRCPNCGKPLFNK
jgi:hypothetical protein